MIPQILAGFATQVPTLLVCLAAGVVVLARWKQAARGAVWAILGFGLALILCFAVPISQTVVHHWVVQGGDVARRAWAFSILSGLWSVSRAATYACLLVAIFAGRPTERAATGLERQ